MGFRTVEISRACEIHIKEGQLEISSDEGTVLIPIEDLSTEFHRQPSILAGDVLTYAIPATLLFFTENGPEYQSYQGPAVKLFTHVWIQDPNVFVSLNKSVAIKLIIGHIIQHIQTEIAYVINCGLSSGFITVNASFLAILPTIKNSSTNAAGTIIGSS